MNSYYVLYGYGRTNSNFKERTVSAKGIHRSLTYQCAQRFANNHYPAHIIKTSNPSKKEALADEENLYMVYIQHKGLQPYSCMGEIDYYSTRTYTGIKANESNLDKIVDKATRTSGVEKIVSGYELKINEKKLGLMRLANNKE